ncbi:hypothetical protein U1Q18_031432 [Sarracenia purpurea var. burkii]
MVAMVLQAKMRERSELGRDFDSDRARRRGNRRSGGAVDADGVAGGVIDNHLHLALQFEHYTSPIDLISG